MRHSNRNKKFGRVRKVRVGLMRTLAVSLILHKKIETGAIKAKALRPFIERLVTLEKRGTIASRRLALSRLGNVTVAESALEAIAKKDFAKRAGGYTRITKLPRRRSDGSERAIIEFVS